MEDHCVAIELTDGWRNREKLLSPCNPSHVQASSEETLVNVTAEKYYGLCVRVVRHPGTPWRRRRNERVDFRRMQTVHSIALRSNKLELLVRGGVHGRRIGIAYS